MTRCATSFKFRQKHLPFWLYYSRCRLENEDMMRVEILNLGRSRILTDRENVLFSAANNGWLFTRASHTQPHYPVVIPSH